MSIIIIITFNVCGHNTSLTFISLSSKEMRAFITCLQKKTIVHVSKLLYILTVITCYCNTHKSKKKKNLIFKIHICNSLYAYMLSVQTMEVRNIVLLSNSQILFFHAVCSLQHVLLTLNLTEICHNKNYYMWRDLKDWQRKITPNERIP